MRPSTITVTMRRSLGKFSKPSIGNAHTLLSSSFSTGAGGGGGRGRGRGSSSSSDLDNFQFGVSSSNPGSSDSKDESNNFQSGMGHGRGKPLPSTPSILPSFSSSILQSGINSTSTSTDNNSSGRGQGGGTILRGPQSESGPKKPIFFLKEDDLAPKAPIGGGGIEESSSSSNLPSSILKVLSGAGRGKPTSASVFGDKVKEENRHLRTRQPERSGPVRERGEGPATAAGRLSPEEARKKAMGILSRGGAVGVGQGSVDGDVRDREVGGGGGGFRGRGSTRGGGGRGRAAGGRGMQSWRGGRGRGRGGRGRGGDRRGQDTEDDYGTGLYLGDDADGEKLATRIGPENMNKLVQGFEEMSGSILPSPMEDALVDALHTNYMIECEPEYLMEEFGTNPDIDEKPPIPLRDALEKMKPFLMAYEGIQSHQEWEEVMKETMEKVPLLKELVDYYSGPDRVTAKRQQEELERVAKTLPDSAPTSVKRFTDRAVLSLQSNPGWGFDKKCQFMDKLVWEVSQHYK